MRRPLPLPALLLAAAAIFAPVATPASAQSLDGTEHGDWVIECETPVGADGEQCALVQHVTAEDREDVGLSVIVLNTADGETTLLRVVAPMGVYLPSGLGLRIDDEDIGATGFVRCVAERIPESRENEVFGCIAEVPMQEDLLARFRAGSTALFIVFQTPEEGIGIPVSLSGFSEGFDALP